MAPRLRRLWPPPAAAAAAGAVAAPKLAAATAIMALLLLLPASKAQQQQQQQPQGRQQDAASDLATASPAQQAAAQLEAALRASVDLPAAEGALLPPTQPADSVGTAAVTLRDVQRGGLCQSGAPPLPVVELTIAQAHAAMLAGRLTCSVLVAAYLQRIQAFDARLGLNSIRSIDPRAAQVRWSGAAAVAMPSAAMPSAEQPSCWGLSVAGCLPCHPVPPPPPAAAAALAWLAARRGAGCAAGGAAGQRHRGAAAPVLRAAASKGQHGCAGLRHHGGWAGGWGCLGTAGGQGARRWCGPCLAPHAVAPRRHA